MTFNGGGQSIIDLLKREHIPVVEVKDKGTTKGSVKPSSASVVEERMKG